jgi:hypothetical protein
MTLVRDWFGTAGLGSRISAPATISVILRLTMAGQV